MKEITEIQPFTNNMEIVHLPASKIIGKEVRSGGKLGNTAIALWDKVFASDIHTVLEGLPNIMCKTMFGWTCDYDPATDTFSYIVCMLVSADTAVPDGYIFRDIPETLCAIGLYGEDVGQTISRVEKIGYHGNWEEPGCGWNAELYFREEEQNPPKQNCTPWHWLVPIKKN